MAKSPDSERNGVTGTMGVSVVKGILFDCDGVLVNSEPMSCGALNVLFQDNFGVDIGTDYSSVLGKSDLAAILFYIEKHSVVTPKTDENLNKLKVQKEQAYYDLASHTLQPFDGCHEFLDFVHNLGLALGVASSGSFSKIQFSLSEVGLVHYFDYISSSSEVVRGKPAPDLFLLAAKKLQIAPQHCVVIEDSVAGVQAGIAAGMRVVGLVGTFTKEALLFAGAHICVESFEEMKHVFGSLLVPNPVQTRRIECTCPPPTSG